MKYDILKYQDIIRLKKSKSEITYTHNNNHVKIKVN